MLPLYALLSENRSVPLLAILKPRREGLRKLRDVLLGETKRERAALTHPKGRGLFGDRDRQLAILKGHGRRGRGLEGRHRGARYSTGGAKQPVGWPLN